MKGYIIQNIQFSILINFVEHCDSGFELIVSNISSPWGKILCIPVEISIKFTNSLELSDLQLYNVDIAVPYAFRVSKTVKAETIMNH